MPVEQSYIHFIQQNLILSGVAAALLGAIVYTEIRRLTKRYQDINPTQAVQLMNREQAVLLDLRESTELESGTIRGSKHLAASVLLKRIDELGNYKDKPVIAFCASGLRAPVACRQLTKHGFTKVHHLKGGLAAWEQANMPITKK